VVVELGNFTRNAMEGRLGSDLPSGIRAAVKHYRRRLESARKPLAVPSFLRRAAGSSGGSFEVAIGADAEATVEREAVRQHVTPQQVLDHAILIYLADMEDELRSSGRRDSPDG
jgi:hypothetical protein